MNTNTYSPAQVEYAEKMFNKMIRPSDDAESLMQMCLQLALQAVVESNENPETVSRTWKCIDCGSRGDRTVTVEWDLPRTAKGLQPASWSCDDCGGSFVENIRIQKKD
jgi:hypothetical protein